MNQQLQKREEAVIEFKPFGETDTIKLTVAIVKQLCCTPTRTGQVCSDRDAFRFAMLCRAQKLDPFVNDAYLVGYDGKNGAQFSLITAHQVFLKRAEASPDYEGMESGIILLGSEGISEREGDFCLPDENVVGGWARVHRKGRKPMYRRLAIEAMKPNYDTPFWSKAKAPAQIVKCAEADALRATFPTVLGGLYTNGEILDISSVRVPTQFPTLKQVSAASGAVAPGPDTPEMPPESAPATDSPAPQANAAAAELAEFVQSNGFTFDHFKKWAAGSGNIEEADSLPGWEALKEADAKRLLRAKTGLLRGLEVAKTEAGV